MLAFQGVGSKSPGVPSQHRREGMPGLLMLLALFLLLSSIAPSAEGLRENSTVSTALSHTVDRPAYVAVEPATGTVLISDHGTHNIYRLHLNGTVALVAGGSTSGYADGTGASARFATPWGIVVHSNGTIYVCDSLNHRVRSIDNGYVNTIAGSGVAGRFDGRGTEALFHEPRGIAWNRNQDYLYVADSQNHRIRQIRLSDRGVSSYAGTTAVGSTTNVFRTSAKFHEPSDLVYDSIHQVLYIADTKNRQLRSVNSSGFANTLSDGSNEYEGYNDTARPVLLSGPYGIALSPDGAFVYIADTGGCAVTAFAVSEASLQTLAGSRCGNGAVDGSSSVATFAAPYGIAYFLNVTLQMYPTLLVADTNASRIRRVSIPVDTETMTSSFENPSGSASASGQAASSEVSSTPSLSFEASSITSTMTSPSRSATRRSCTPSLTRGVSSTAPPSDSVKASPVVSPSGSHSMGNATPSASVGASGTALLNASTSSSLSLQALLTPTIERGEVTVTPSGTTRTSSSSVAGSSSSHSLSPSQKASRSDSVVVSATNPKSATRSVQGTASKIMISSSASSSLGGTASRNATSPSSSLPSPSSSANASRSSFPSASLSASTTWERSLSEVISSSRSFSRTVDLVLSESPSQSVWDCASTLDHSTVALVNVVEGISPPSFRSRHSLVLLPSEAVSSQRGGRREYNGSTEEDPLLAAPLPRIPLLTRTDGLFPALHLNVSVSHPTAAQRWRVARVVLSDMHDLLFEGVTMNTEGHHDLILQPPSGASLGWLPDDTFLYSTAEVLISVFLECDGRPVGTLRIVIPSPGAPVPLAEEVKTAVRVTQWVSILSGSGSGSSVGRVAAIRSMALCSSGDASGGGGLLGLQIASSSSSNACVRSTVDKRELIEYARGAVVGNTVLVVGACALVGLVSLLLATCARWRLLFACRRLALPSTLFPLWVVVIPSTAGATALLVAESVAAGCASDVGLVILGAALCLGPLALCAALFLVYAPRFGLAAHRTAQGPCWLSPGSTFAARALHVVAVATRRRVRWSSASKQSHDSSADHNSNHCNDGDGPPERHAWVLLLEFRYLWYAPLDAIVLLSAGALGAVSGLSASLSLCYGTVGAILFLYLAQLIVCIACRPLTTLLALVHAAMTLALSCGSVAFQLAYYAVNSNSSTANDASWLMEASAVCDLFVVGITIARIIIDLYDVAKSIRRIASRVSLRSEVAMEATRSDASLGKDKDDDDFVRKKMVSSSMPANGSHRSVLNDEGSNASPPLPPLHDWGLNEHQNNSSEDDDILRRHGMPQQETRSTQQRQGGTGRSSVWPATAVEVDNADPFEGLFWDDNGKAVKRTFTMFEYNDGSEDNEGGGDGGATILMVAPSGGKS